ncbi:MAG TPA: DUF4166 domain-containing protein [Dongiaceae bacterium]
MRRIVVIGGTGTFGSRIARLLAKRQRWEIVIAGRSRSRAEAFAKSLSDPKISAAALDSGRNLLAALTALKPWLVIDVSGPFQGAEVSDYPVARVALACGAHYIDIADALGCVTHIDRLDAGAKQKGLVVISGASSVPTLSSAVIADLARDLDEVLEVEIAISSSNQATLGHSVHAALLSYAGKPIRIRRFGAWVENAALRDWRKIAIAVPGRAALHRRVALCEVPDLALLPARYPALRKAMFRAGTELNILNLASAVLAWAASHRLVESPDVFAGFASPAFNLLRRFGSGRSGMAIDLRGRRGDAFLSRRWTVLAEQGDGLWIPALAAALLTDRLDRGALAPGARPGIDVLALADFRAEFAGLAIHEATEELPLGIAPFRRWLGAAVDRLPPAIRRLHDDPLERGASGTAKVIRGTHPLAVLMCRCLGFPRSADSLPLRVEFEPQGGAEIWCRHFPGSRFVSRLRPWRGRPGHVLESIGPITYGFRLDVAAEGLHMNFQAWWLCGVPLPRFLGPRIEARQWQESETYCFSVEVGVPGLGRVIAYRGRLALD